MLYPRLTTVVTSVSVCVHLSLHNFFSKLFNYFVFICYDRQNCLKINKINLQLSPFSLVYILPPPPLPDSVAWKGKKDIPSEGMDCGIRKWLALLHESGFQELLPIFSYSFKSYSLMCVATDQ